MRERHHSVHVGVAVQDTAVLDPGGDELRRGGGAVDRSQDPNVVPGTDGTVHPPVPLERCALAFGYKLALSQSRPTIAGPVEFPIGNIVDVNMFALPDRASRETDDLAIFPDRLIGLDGPQRHLVAGGN